MKEEIERIKYLALQLGDMSKEELMHSIMSKGETFKSGMNYAAKQILNLIRQIEDEKCEHSDIGEGDGCGCKHPLNDRGICPYQCINRDIKCPKEKENEKEGE